MAGRTRVGVTGPMLAYGTFTAKEEAEVGAGSATRLPLMGASGWLLWLLGRMIYAWN